MISEWLKIMLEEISRKQLEQEQARVEEKRRRRAAGVFTTAAPGARTTDSERAR